MPSIEIDYVVPKNLEEKDGQIKDCNKILKSHGKQSFFFTLSGPTGSLNTKVLFKEYKLFAYVYQLL